MANFGEFHLQFNRRRLPSAWPGASQTRAQTEPACRRYRAFSSCRAALCSRCSAVVAARFRFQRVELSAARMASVSACCLTLVTCSRIVADGEAATAGVAAQVSRERLPGSTGMTGTGSGSVALRPDFAFSSRASIWASREIRNFRMKFSSSRTFPGQWYAVMACLSSGVIAGIGIRRNRHGASSGTRPSARYLRCAPAAAAGRH